MFFEDLAVVYENIKKSEINNVDILKLEAAEESKA